MSKLLQGTAITLMLIGFTGCVDTDDIKVEGTKSENIIPSEYKTYSFIQGNQIASSIKGVNVLNDQKINSEIQQIINNELVKKGKKLVSKTPDFHVTYIAGTAVDSVKNKLDEKGKIAIEKTPKGAIAFIIIDANTGEIIGMSTAEGDIKNLSEKEKKKRLTYAIKKMVDSL